MKYFYDFRRHFYNLLASFANDMRDAAGRLGGEEELQMLLDLVLVLELVLVKWIRRIIKPKVISHRTCLQKLNRAPES